jgi:hypothetical protein
VVFLCSVKMIFFWFSDIFIWNIVVLCHLFMFILFFRHFHLDHCGALSCYGFSLFFVFQTFPFGSLRCFAIHVWNGWIWWTYLHDTPN